MVSIICRTPYPAEDLPSVRRQNKWDSLGYFLTEDLAHLGLMLRRLALMVQAAILDGQFLDLFSPFNRAYPLNAHTHNM